MREYFIPIDSLGRKGVFGISRRGMERAADGAIPNAAGRYRALIGVGVALAVIVGGLAVGSGRTVSLTLLSVVGTTPS